MSIIAENAKKWFSPFTAWKQRSGLRGELDYLFQGLYRMFTGQLNRPWISAAEEDDLKNHLGFFDYIIPVAYPIETFCRGYWLHKIPSIQNVEKAKKILTASTCFIWVPLNVLRATFGVVCTTVAIIVGILFVLPIALLVSKLRSGRPSSESDPENQDEPEMVYETMTQDEDPYMNPYGIPRPARPGKFWGKHKTDDHDSKEVPITPPRYQEPHPRSTPKLDTTPGVYREPKPLMYGEASSDPVTAAVSPGF